MWELFHAITQTCVLSLLNFSRFAVHTKYVRVKYRFSILVLWQVSLAVPLCHLLARHSCIFFGEVCAPVFPHVGAEEPVVLLLIALSGPWVSFLQDVPDECRPWGQTVPSVGLTGAGSQGEGCIDLQTAGVTLGGVPSPHLPPSQDLACGHCVGHLALMTTGLANSHPPASSSP